MALSAPDVRLVPPQLSREKIREEFRLVVERLYDQWLIRQQKAKPLVTGGERKS